MKPTATWPGRQPARPAARASASVTGMPGWFGTQPGHVGALQVGEHAGGQDRLGGAGDRQVRERHRRDRLRSGRTASRAARRRRSWNRSGWMPNSIAVASAAALMPDVAGDARRDDPAAAVSGERPAIEPVDAVADERHHERHVEGVGAVRQHAAVAEEQRLEQQRDARRRSPPPTGPSRSR